MNSYISIFKQCHVRTKHLYTHWCICIPCRGRSVAFVEPACTKKRNKRKYIDQAYVLME